VTSRRWLIPVAILIGVALVIVLPLIGSYNNLVEQEGSVDQSFADLDSQLQRRADLIPNLSSAVRAALKQEQAVFGEIARARTQYGGANTVEEKADATNALNTALGRLLVVIESYPQLDSNDTIRDLMTQVEGTENRVNQGRREYNEAVRTYNVYVRRFPRSIIAGMFGFDPKQFFEAEAGAEEAPDVDLDVSPAPSG
jgi:LemA protein